MSARSFEELECWKLAHALKLEVYAVLERAPVKDDRRFCDQIRESARSAASNIAEGYGRFRPLDFARFLEIAKASLAETHNHLIDVHDRRYLTSPEADALITLTKRASGATTKLIRYLKGPGRQGPPRRP